MTDVGNMQAGAVGTAQVAARPTIQVVPLRGLPIKDHVRGAPWPWCW